MTKFQAACTHKSSYALPSTCKGYNYKTPFADPVTYLSAGIDLEYLHSVTIIIKPMKCLISAENYVAIAQWYRKL